MREVKLQVFLLSSLKNSFSTREHSSCIIPLYISTLWLKSFSNRFTTDPDAPAFGSSAP